MNGFLRAVNLILLEMSVFGPLSAKSSSYGWESNTPGATGSHLLKYSNLSLDLPGRFLLLCGPLQSNSDARDLSLDTSDTTR